MSDATPDTVDTHAPKVDTADEAAWDRLMSDQDREPPTFFFPEISPVQRSRNTTSEREKTQSKSSQPIQREVSTSFSQRELSFSSPSQSSGDTPRCKYLEQATYTTKGPDHRGPFNNSCPVEELSEYICARHL